MTGKSSRLAPTLGSLAVAAGVILCAVLLWGLRILILPVAAGALFAYVCYPLVANLERFRLTRDLAIVLLLAGLVLVGLFVVTQLRASIPDESGRLELRVRALHNINRRYAALMGLDKSLTAGNGFYQLVRADVDPLLDRVNRAVALEPEERPRFLASRTSRSAESDRLLRYDAENQQMLEARGQAALARSGRGGASAESVAARDARAKTPLASLGGILSTWIVAPAVFLFFLRDTGEIKRRFFRMIPNRLFEPVLAILADLDRALGGWLRGICLESGFLGVTMAVLLAVLGVPLGWAILIGLAAAAANPIPYVGSAVALLGGVAYALVADTVDPLLPWVRGDRVALWMVVGVALIEIVKNLVFEPFVVGQAAELHPLVVLVGVLGGGILFGAVGLVLALPTLTISRALVSSTARQFRAYGLV